MKKMKILLSLYLIVFVSCLKKEGSPHKGLIIPIKSEISTLDPHLSYDLVSNLIVYQVYETLFQYHYLKRPYSLEPLLAAEEPKVSNDGLKYEIKIKPNILYHNQKDFSEKRAVKASDFVMSFKRLAFKGTDSKGWWLLKGKIKGLDQFREAAGQDIQALIHKKVKGLQAPDDETLIIELTSPFPQLVHILSMTFTSPVPEELVLKNKNKFENIGFGTGPYQIIEFDAAKFARLKKHEGYNVSTYPVTGDRIANERELLKKADSSLPLSEEITFKIIVDDEKRWQAFLNKQLDFVDIPPSKLHYILNLNGDLKSDYRKKDMELHVSSSMIFWWLAFNMRDPLIGKNKNLRKAISHAINIEQYIANFYYNTGRRANSIFPPGVLGYNPSQDFHHDYNIRKAKRFLAKAGYPGGKGLPVLEFHTRRNGERHILMAQFIKKELSKIGIAVRVVVNKFTDFLNKAKKAKMQFWQGGWLMDYPDPENVLQLLYSKNANGGPNKTGFSNSRFDKLYKKLLITRDDTEKLTILKEMEDIVIEEVPWIMTNYSIHYLIRHEYLKNFRYSDLVLNMYKYLEK